jgi:hypothetical protein
VKTTQNLPIKINFPTPPFITIHQTMAVFASISLCLIVAVACITTGVLGADSSSEERGGSGRGGMPAQMKAAMEASVLFNSSEIFSVLKIEKVLCIPTVNMLEIFVIRNLNFCDFFFG